MKNIFCLFLGLLTISAGYSQITLPKDETGKITFTEVVKLDSTYSSTLLFNNAQRWVKLLRNENKKPLETIEDPLTGTISGSNNYFVYVETFKIGVLKKLSGHISYDFKIEVKQGRYKYTFTNFVFHYYDMNRVNSYDYLTPKPNGRKKKLEDEKAAGWGATWKAHKATTLEKMQAYAENLKKIMAEDPDKERLFLQQKQTEQEKLKSNW